MRNKSPLVSIVTPSYNQARFLEETIKSVINQKYKHIEYLIIDGGSTDGSINIIKKYNDRIDYWVSEPDNGQSHAINKGLRRAHGEILGWINSDDILLPNAVHRSVNFLNEHPNIDIVYSNANRIDEEGIIIKRAKINNKQQVFSIRTMIGECTVTQPGSFWRRWVTDEVGLLDENLNYVMDYELWIRMALGGARFAQLSNSPHANFRLSKDSKTVSQFDMSGHETIVVLNKYLSDPELSNKLGVPRVILNIQGRRAKALACIKIFQAHSQRVGESALAWQWLRKSILLYPLIIIKRHRAILYSFREMLRVSF